MCGLNCIYNNNDVTTHCSPVTNNQEPNQTTFTINITIAEDLVTEGVLSICCQLLNETKQFNLTVTNSELNSKQSG